MSVNRVNYRHHRNAQTPSNILFGRAPHTHTHTYAHLSRSLYADTSRIWATYCEAQCYSAFLLPANNRPPHRIYIYMLYVHTRLLLARTRCFSCVWRVRVRARQNCNRAMKFAFYRYFLFAAVDTQASSIRTEHQCLCMYVCLCVMLTNCVCVSSSKT